MLGRNWGRVIFVSSEAAAEVHPDMIHYGVTKAGQLVVSRGLAEMTKGTRVTVNSVLPGPTRSEAIVGFLQGLASSPDATPEQAEKEFFERDRPRDERRGGSCRGWNLAYHFVNHLPAFVP